MTIRALYTPAIIAKAHKVSMIAKAKHPRSPEKRDEVCREICGMTFAYLRRVGSSFKHPSARTLSNLGFELYVKDLDTGEMSLLETDYKCDWNPANPIMNPVCTPIFGDTAPEISTSSE